MMKKWNVVTTYVVGDTDQWAEKLKRKLFIDALKLEQRGKIKQQRSLCY
jgi:hypothetical protein